MLWDMEMTWGKALTYIHGEPHRSILRRRLARLRFVLALSGSAAGGRTSIEELMLARQTSPETISRLAVALGLVVLVVPGLSRLAFAKPLRPLRELGARLLQIKESTPHEPTIVLGKK